MRVSNTDEKKKFFVGIDSDGTVFDTMTIKHRDAFVPAANRIWDATVQSESFERSWQRYNLFSKYRGQNRFVSLLWGFTRMEQMGYALPDYTDLREWVHSGKSLSVQGLRAHLQSFPSGFLDDVLRWSCLAEQLYEKATANVVPFASAPAGIKYMAQSAGLGVVSLASSASIRRDWAHAGLLGYVGGECGQDNGSKLQQLAAHTKGRCSKDKILLLGDTLVDLAVAKKFGCLFYPIIPGKENECWQKLRDEAFDRFVEKSYAGNYEKELCQALLQVLKG